MKTSIIYLFIAICVALLLNSCATSKDSLIVEKNVLESTSYAKEVKDIDKQDCFVELNDGSIKKYASLKLVTGIFTTPHLLADGKIVIHPKELKAYRDLNYYAVSQKQFYTGAKAYVATHVLPGFAVRVVKGNLNLYALQFYGSGNVYKKYFLQNGADGEILPFSADLLSLYTNNSTEIKAILKKNSKKVNTKQMIASVYNYNNTTFISKN